MTIAIRTSAVATAALSTRPAPAQPWRFISLLGVCVAVAVLLGWAHATPAGYAQGAPSIAIALTISIMMVAVWAWVATAVDDTLVAFFAAVALVLVGVLPAEQLFASLGDQTIWLLIGAFVIANAVSNSGLALRVAARILTFARTPRTLFHLTTVALTLTAFAIPATSGRAAVAVPIFVALTAAIPARAAVLKALSLLFPTVILLSAVASLLGAGAHIITSQLVAAATGEGFSFLMWLWLGLPLAMVSSHLACEIVLLRFTSRTDRRERLRISLDDLASAGTVTGPLSNAERTVGMLVIAVVALWSTSSLHSLSPALVALLGAVAVVAPGASTTSLPAAIKQVPWNLLLFLAATLALAATLTSTGAAQWLSEALLAPLAGLGASAGIAFVLVVIALSIGAHLLIPSRSARSAAIIPIVVALAPGLGIEPAAAAFASTAAAGFCHTLPSSAKPVAMFADPDVIPNGFTAADLRSLSAILAPAMFSLVAVFSLWVWPAMGLPLFIQ